MVHRTLAAIPAYNEEVAIGSVVLRCRAYVNEVLVIDDGSQDRTTDVAKLAKATVYQHHYNAGKGAAIHSALQYARLKGFDAMVFLDGDGQHDPAFIPDLLEPILAGDADVVVGRREKHTSKMPMYRRFGMRLLDLLTAVGGLDQIRDSQSGYRALSRAAIDALNLQERDFAVESEMLIEAKERELRVVEVPISVRYDVDGSTKAPIIHGIGAVDRILRIVASRHPLLFIGIPATALLFVGLWLGVDTLVVYYTQDFYAEGKALITVIFLMLGALALFSAIILNAMPKAILRAEAIRNHRRPPGELK